MCKKVVPSDRFKISMSSITRLAPLANPIYDRVRIDYDAFFVQNRIIDPDWKSFITGGEGLYGEKSTDGMNDIRAIATLSLTKDDRDLVGAGSLMDYLGLQFSSYDESGLPVDKSISETFYFNGLPVLAYYKVFSDWYRNERLDPDLYDAIMSSSGSYNSSSRLIQFGSRITSGGTSTWKSNFLLGNIVSRRYGKDPYTTALSEPIIGGPVAIPVLRNSENRLPTMYYSSSIGARNINASTNQQGVVNITVPSVAGTTTSEGQLVVAISDAVAGTIQQLNQAYKLFSFFMKDTYNGNRYVEFIESHFGVRVPDSTLERPIFLGRHTQWLNFSEIFQNSGSTAKDNTLGDYAGVGISSGNGFLFDQTFDEHGYIMVIQSIRPESTYFQGVNPEMRYGDRFSYFFPEFQNIGDEPVYTSGLWFELGGEDTLEFGQGINFGYNRRWSDYLWYKDEMHGNFLMENQMYNWTFARKFTSEPMLSVNFIEVPSINTPFVYTADSSMNFFTDIYFKISALRPIEKYEHF